MLFTIVILAMHVVLRELDGLVCVLKREHGIGVHEVGEVLVSLCPCGLILADL